MHPRWKSFLCYSVANIKHSFKHPIRGPSMKSFSYSFTTISNDTPTTYSGGHPIIGQGGYYGSLETRSEKEIEREQGLAVTKEDLNLLQKLMVKCAGSDPMLQEEMKEHKEFRGLLQRLWYCSSPVWGLSLSEREFVKKMKKCCK